jgi:hypothetical protein
MTGYTSRGAGASSIPLRFNCPGEITVITLRKDKSEPPDTSLPATASDEILKKDIVEAS